MGNYVILPWPHKDLHPNSRKKHLHCTAIRKEYKSDCWALAKSAKLDRDKTHLSITFNPPDNRRRDLDNMLSAIKYGLDGMALALGVDDYTWSFSIRRGEKVNGGAVYIEVMDSPYAPDVVSVPMRGVVS